MIAKFSNLLPRISRLLGWLMALSPILAYAESPQWTLDPSVKAGFEYNDNFNVTNQATRVWFSRFSADFLSKMKLSRFDMDLRGRYYGERYISVDGPVKLESGEKTTTDDLTRDDGKFDAKLGYQVTEYMLWQLNGGYTRDQPSSSELDGTDQIRLFDRITRNRWNVGPALTWILTPQTSLKTNYSYSETFYEDQTDESDRSDFISHNASITLDHQYTEYTKLFGQVFYSNFQTDQELGSSSIKFESDQIGAITGIEHTFSDTFSAALSGGGLVLFSSREGSNDKITDTNIGYLVNFNLTKQFEYTTITAAADHNLIPTASGGQLQSDSVSLNVKQRLLEHLDVILSGRLSKTDDAQKNANVRVRNETGRTNYSANLSFNWKFDKDWSLQWGYKFFRQERDGGETGNRNAAFVDLRYQWPTELLFR